MKKPVLGVLGVAGACAACCAIPLAIPLITGASAVGLTSLIGLEFLDVSGEVLIAGAGLGASLLVGAGLWWSRRRKAAACGVAASASPAGGAGGSQTTGASCACPAPSTSGAKA